MWTPGPLEIIIILVIVLIVFGPKRLPDLGKSLGRGMREFKDSVTGKDKDELPDDIVARIEGKSSLGRLGLIVHATAGFVDPGFSGTLTLEITNLTRVPIVLWPGKPIAQLSFMALDQAAERPYGHPDLGSHYHGQVEATESRYEGGPGTKPETR